MKKKNNRFDLSKKFDLNSFNLIGKLLIGCSIQYKYNAYHVKEDKQISRRE